MPEIFASQPTLEDAAPALRVRPCATCGAPVETGDRFCPACGVEQPAAAESAKAGTGAEQKHFQCKNCGAEVAIDPDRRSYACPFCDSNYVVEFSPEQSGRQPPEFVVGFAVPPEQALQRFREWLGRNSWFRPNDLRLAQVEGKLRGVYIPFWSFSMLAESRWAAEIGEHWTRTETYTTRENGKTVTKTRHVTETEWWDLSGGHHEYYSGYLVSGSRGLPQKDADRITPFHLAALKRYAPYFLAGWLCEEYSVARQAAEQVSRAAFEQMEQRNIAAFLPGDTYRNLQTQTEFSRIGSDLILLPIYLLSYRYRNKLYRYLLNGQTGKAAGDKPLSAWRVGLAIGIAVLLIAALAFLVPWLSR
ncbi:MAG: zinc ribbon domain-containing protein [Pirellulales bacterium]|nr:zinc ribbon domain-containing protein [Pirellulales bacterium]